jgi:hypothetical protein
MVVRPTLQVKARRVCHDNPIVMSASQRRSGNHMVLREYWEVGSRE